MLNLKSRILWEYIRNPDKEQKNSQDQKIYIKKHISQYSIPTKTRKLCIKSDFQ